jgi:hypothetical protein
MKNLIFSITYLVMSMTIAGQAVDENAISGQYIVMLRGNTDAHHFFSTGYDIQKPECLSKSMNIWLVKTEATDMLESLTKDPSVILAQYNHGNIRQRSLIPNDSLFNMQWNMHNTGTPGADISAPQAWQINHSAVTRMGDTIVIAVIDGTFDLAHPDLNFFVNKNEIPNNGRDDDGNGYIDDYLGWNVFTNNDSVQATNLSDEHATHVSGIAAAKGNNGIGVAGVCWGAKILAVTGADNAHIVYESDIVKAYDYVIEMRRIYDQTSGSKGAFIVATNSSFGVDLGQPINFPIWCSLYDTLGKYGILSVTATVNLNWNVDMVGDMPTTCPSQWMIAATNITRSGTRNGAAGYGKINIDIGAPGSGVVSTVPFGGYGTDQGTSMATPHITGTVAALIANACPRLLQDYLAYPDSISLMLKDYILRSADPIASMTNLSVSGGGLNLYHAYLMEGDYNCNSCNYALSMMQTPITCTGYNDATLTVSVASHPGSYRYLWSNGDTTSSIQQLSSGFYQVTVTDTSGCQRQESAVVSAPWPISIRSVSIIPLGTSSPGNFIISASAGFDSLFYAMDTGSYSTSGIFVTDSPGIHHFHIRSQYGCVIDTSLGIYYTGIEEGGGATYMSLSPNPASQLCSLLIRSDGDCDMQLTIVDISGRQVHQRKIHIAPGISERQLDISDLSNGIYLLNIADYNGVRRTIKMTVINN